MITKNLPSAKLIEATTALTWDGGDDGDENCLFHNYVLLDGAIVTFWYNIVCKENLPFHASIPEEESETTRVAFNVELHGHFEFGDLHKYRDIRTNFSEIEEALNYLGYEIEKSSDLRWVWEKGER